MQGENLKLMYQVLSMPHKCLVGRLGRGINTESFTIIIRPYGFFHQQSQSRLP